MENPKRTDGDGMEQADDNYISENNKAIGKDQIQKIESLRDKFIYNPEDYNSSTLKPPIISGRIIQLRPAPIIVRASKHESHSRSLQAKEPKFVPYEPYKGAVNPLIPLEKNSNKKKTKTISLVSLPEAHKKSEEKNTYQECLSVSPPEECNQPMNLSDENIQKELERLRKENQQLENQLKFQIQVLLFIYF